MQRHTYPEDDLADLIIKGTGSRTTTGNSNSNGATKLPNTKRGDAEDRVAFRQLETHLRQRGFEQSRCDTIWEIIR